MSRREDRPIESYDVLSTVRASNETRTYSSKRVKKHCICALVNEPTTVKEMKTFYTIAICTSIKLERKRLFCCHEVLISLQ